MEVIDFEARHRGKCTPLHIETGTCRRSVLAACRYFAAELVEIEHEYQRQTAGRSFHIILPKTGNLSICCENEDVPIEHGHATLVPACFSDFTIRGTGSLLDYYVPDLEEDIFSPLLRHGHSRDDVIALGAH